MPGMARRVVDYEMTVAEWLGATLLAGAPYGVIGLFLAIFKPDHLAGLDGVQKVVAFVGSVLFWPVLLFVDVCLP